MKLQDHRDPEYYTMQVRAQELGERASFLEVSHFGKSMIRALYKLNITNVSHFLAEDPDDLYRKLEPFGVLAKNPAKAKRQIDRWTNEMVRLIQEREGKTLGPTGQWG